MLSRQFCVCSLVSLPVQSNEEGLVLISEALKAAGCEGKVKIAMDCAASEFYSECSTGAAWRGWWARWVLAMLWCVGGGWRQPGRSTQTASCA